ncbi:early activation antigen CD69-like [Falco naumanni]|uniref:early activation antigen CD69-like n=1 Tax=Falco naumanni TaxID=148594 RepID=UPI001ADE5EAF|nr:early activation antigen CD69-like [Falco naumanni]XP_040451452.1 early activation antigen CD69-like [Falco naumanni]XP_040451453.1 early activation antigen CD69-like [Falco naumanni]XP_040451454.1 early activation antigen CD69-like [Falco naumanni]XP_040451456.1 early activation antigen CD69-like [Falco naumanni]XP_040451457.1 early activation antigen CD69-like [Falco naumanni]
MDTEIAQMTQAFLEDAKSSNAKQGASQDVEASSCVWKTRRCFEERFKKHKCCVCVFLLVVLVLVLVLSFITKCRLPSGAEPATCPRGWIGYRDKCYSISEDQKNWTSSQTTCVERGSSLPVFESLDELRALAKLLKLEDVWIGLRKIGERYCWENGTALEMDEFHIQNHSDCAYLYDSVISTSACSLPRYYICQASLKR